jgi:hypothetical protein
VLFAQSPDYLLISNAAAAAFAAARLLQFNLTRRFPFLSLFLIGIFVFDTALSLFSFRSRTYFWVYVVADPLIYCIAVLSVRETFALIFRTYPGLRTAGGWAMNIALAVALVIFVAFFRQPSWQLSRNSVVLFYELAFDRMIHFAMALVILAQMYFLSRYPLQLDRNARVASVCFSSIFLIQSAARVVDTLFPHQYFTPVDRAEVALTALCYLSWGLMLRAATAYPVKQAAVPKTRETELLHQLDTLNEMVNRAGRR